MRTSCRRESLTPKSAQLIAVVLRIAAPTACAGSHAPSAPPATAATEPEPSTAGGVAAQAPPPIDPATLKESQHAIDTAANKSEQIADRTSAKADYASEHGSVAGAPADQLTDLELATKIRRALFAADGLSSGARNVSVLVDQGRVTLTGRVESAVEKARVEEMARSIVDTTSIDNELEVTRYR